MMGNSATAGQTSEGYTSWKEHFEGQRQWRFEVVYNKTCEWQQQVTLYSQLTGAIQVYVSSQL